VQQKQRERVDVDARYVESLFAIGRRCGADHLGIAPASVMHRARNALVERKQAGLHDSMQFTYRNPERSTEPERAVPGARSMVVAARSYVLDAPVRPQDGPYGSVARYAWVDHYEPLRFALQNIAVALRADGFKAVAVADDNSLVDREAAWLAGLGWFGKNANVLLPGSGSFFVLGSVITDAALPPTAAPVADGCGGCRRCIDACPTGAIIDTAVIDAGRCLAWLLQRPGIFPRQYRRALGDRIYGCDDCQTVCPPTVRFERRSAGNQADNVQAWVSLLDLLAASDADLLSEYGRWYLAGRNPMWLRRNALVALGNSGRVGTDQSAPVATDARVVDVLRRYLAHTEPMLRAHAVWAASELGLGDLLPGSDPDPDVADELAAARG
jgi:epoxyqueuosine reductase